MTLQSKIFLSNAVLAAAVITAFAVATDTFPGNGFFLMLAFITATGGAGCVALALLLSFRTDKRATKVYLISGIIFLVIALVSYFFLKQY